jgi:hypothetical protein
MKNRRNDEAGEIPQSFSLWRQFNSDAAAGVWVGSERGGGRSTRHTKGAFLAFCESKKIAFNVERKPLIKLFKHHLFIKISPLSPFFGV